MELTGTFKQKGEIETLKNDFQKQEFYLDLKRFNSNTGEPIENLLKFQATKAPLFEVLRDLQKGDEIKIQFNISGRLFDKKDGTGKAHAQNLEAWKIEKVIKEDYHTAKPFNETPNSSNAGNLIEDEDNLPF